MWNVASKQYANNTNPSPTGPLNIKVQGDLNAEMAILHHQNAKILTTFHFANAAQSQSVFTQVLEGTYDQKVTSWLTGTSKTSLVLAPSTERAVLLELSYNGVLAGSSTLHTDVLNNDRADAWHEIRFDSNGGASESAGIAKARYYEADMFGLYKDPAHVTLQEALGAYNMNVKFKADISGYDKAYGAEVAQANTDYHTKIVNTTAQALAPALALLEKTYTHGVSVSSVYGDGTNGGDISQSDTITGDSGNDLILGEQSTNELIGGSGNDTLVALTGNNTIAGGGGQATLEGSNGNNLIITGALYTSYGSPDLGAGSNDPVTIIYSGGADTIDCFNNDAFRSEKTGDMIQFTGAWTASQIKLVNDAAGDHLTSGGKSLITLGHKEIDATFADGSVFYSGSPDGFFTQGTIRGSATIANHFIAGENVGQTYIGGSGADTFEAGGSSSMVGGSAGTVFTVEDGLYANWQGSFAHILDASGKGELLMEYGATALPLSGKALAIGADRWSLSTYNPGSAVPYQTYQLHLEAMAPCRSRMQANSTALSKARFWARRLIISRPVSWASHLRRRPIHPHLCGTLRWSAIKQRNPLRDHGA